MCHTHRCPWSSGGGGVQVQQAGPWVSPVAPVTGTSVTICTGSKADGRERGEESVQALPLGGGKRGVAGGRAGQAQPQRPGPAGQRRTPVGGAPSCPQRGAGGTDRRLFAFYTSASWDRQDGAFCKVGQTWVRRLACPLGTRCAPVRSTPRGWPRVAQRRGAPRARRPAAPRSAPSSSEGWGPGAACLSGPPVSRRDPSGPSSHRAVLSEPRGTPG